MAGVGVSDLVVLVVEPSPTQCRIITDALNAAGVEQPLIEADGTSALSRMLHALPDLVVSALYLPDMTGTELVQRMRVEPATRDTAFVLISSETRLDVLDPIKQAGALAILPKPFDARDLVVALNSTLSLVDPEDTEGEYENLSVLLVDDSPLARKHISHVLNAMGINNISEAEDGTQALQLVNRQFFDFVVTDYNMPNMDGCELVEAIRGQSSQSSVPVLMVTSEHNNNRLSAVQNAGVSAICDKPFEPETVRRLVASILKSA